MTLPNASDDDVPGKTAYEVYCTAVGGRSINDDPLPPWDEQNERIQDAWNKAAVAVWQRWRDEDL